jgi:hypothetical protein
MVRGHAAVLCLELAATAQGLRGKAPATRPPPHRRGRLPRWAGEETRVEMQAGADLYVAVRGNNRLIISV